ncbi:MAG: hypothetical protein RR630_02710 [Coprobacillus sp.]
MKKGIIVELKDQYTFVLCHNANIKRIKRAYNHEIGQEIQVSSLSLNKIIPIALVSCIVVLMIFMNPFQDAQTVNALSYVSLKVNPGLILQVNDKNKVVAISYTNKEGQQLTQSVDLVNQTLEDSVILFIDYCFDNQYFDNNQNIDINILSDNNQQIKDLEQQVNDIINQYIQKRQVKLTIAIDKVSDSQQKEAQTLGIPDSKIKLIDLVLKYYPNFKKDELAKMSIDDLVDYLEDAGLDEKMLDKLEDDLEEKEESTGSKEQDKADDNDNNHDQDDDDDHDEDDDGEEDD